ncbi:hypothetical protein BGZ88_006681, partial [Linnemannia elongata]
MSRSKEAIINEILNKYTHNLADVGQFVNPLGRLGATKRQGFTRFSKMFCDSMVFWAPVNSADEEVKGKFIGKYMADLREAFGKADLPCDSIKSLHSGTLLDHEYIPADIQTAHAQENSNGPYSAGFTSIKVSLYHSHAKKVVMAMAVILPILRKRYLVLHDIDMTHDC